MAEVVRREDEDQQQCWVFHGRELAREIFLSQWIAARSFLTPTSHGMSLNEQDKTAQHRAPFALPNSRRICVRRS